MKRDVAQAPKRVRRFQSQSRWKGHTTLGAMHVGRYSRLPGIWGYWTWHPACATEEQLLKWAAAQHCVPGQELSAGATAHITCKKCLTILAGSAQ